MNSRTVQDAWQQGPLRKEGQRRKGGRKNEPEERGRGDGMCASMLRFSRAFTNENIQMTAK